MRGEVAASEFPNCGAEREKYRDSAPHSFFRAPQSRIARLREG